LRTSGVRSRLLRDPFAPGKGKVVSVDEIRFTGQVGEFGTEELVARRAK
jgi:hypothetical protein